MVALEILLNGKPFCTAGADNFSTLTACLLVVGELGDHTPLEGDKAKLKGSIKPELLISGAAGNKHRRWRRGTQVSVGDALEIRLVRVAPEAADPPDPTIPLDPKETAEFERRSYEHHKAIYLQLRDKYDSPDP